MELTFHHGKINKQTKNIERCNEIRQRSQTGEWSFKGKERMTINRRIMIMPG